MNIHMMAVMAKRNKERSKTDMRVHSNSRSVVTEDGFNLTIDSDRSFRGYSRTMRKQFANEFMSLLDIMKAYYTDSIAQSLMMKNSPFLPNIKKRKK